MTRLTDLIQGQSDQKSITADVKGSALPMKPTGLPHPPSGLSLSGAEIDWHQRACHEIQGIKRAVQTRQPWVIDDVVSIAAGIVNVSSNQ